MTESPTIASPGQLAIRGSGLGALLVLVVVGLVWTVLSDASQDAIGGAFLGFGIGVGLLSGSIGNSLIAFGSMLPAEDPRSSSGFLRAVVLDFALQFVCAAVCVFGLILKEVKFQQVAAFGVSFAFAVIVCRMFGTVVVSRALAKRARSRQQAQQAATTATGPNL